MSSFHNLSSPSSSPLLANLRRVLCWLAITFVRRMVKFIERNQDSGFYSRTFGVDHLCKVKTIGIGRRTVEELIKFDLQTIRGTAPTVVIMGIGSNNLCDKEADPDMVALSILALVELLLNDIQLRCLVLHQVLPRKTSHFRDTTKGFGILMAY